MTAREIIEPRLGRKLPQNKDLPRDLRVAVLRLGLQLVEAKL